MSVAAAFVVLLGALPATADGPFDRAARDFAARLDAHPLRLLAVQYRGRVAILDTLAREQLSQITGTERPGGLEPVVAYLELYFRSGDYLDAPVIHVRERPMRRALAGRLEGQWRDEFERTGRLPPVAILNEDQLAALLRADRLTVPELLEAGRVPSLVAALGELSYRPEFRVPLERLSIRIRSFVAAGMLRVLPAEGGLAAPDAPAAGPLPGTRELWGQFREAWRRRDAAAVNRLVPEVLKIQGAAGVGLPPWAFRRLERLYNRTYKLTIAWVGFAAAAVLLLIAAAGRLRWARRAGLAVMAGATAVFFAGFLVRWILSGRAWYLPPIMNQFEAVTGSALLAAVFAMAAERVWPRSYFAFAGALYATLALLGALLFSSTMEEGIAAQPGILHSPIMAAHVAVIIVGHALVGMTFVLSGAYLAAAAMRRRAALETLDRCNLLTAQLATLTVVAGTLLGAWWAEAAWGRWWGWDPKETWALVTALIYLAVLHARLVVPARRRGLVTALGCIVGCAAMLFNWIVVNYYLVGKHGYA